MRKTNHKLKSLLKHIMLNRRFMLSKRRMEHHRIACNNFASEYSKIVCFGAESLTKLKTPALNLVRKDIK